MAANSGDRLAVCAAWLSTHRSQAEPCFEMCPCRTARSEPRTVGVSPAQLASLRALGKRDVADLGHHHRGGELAGPGQCLEYLEPRVGFGVLAQLGVDRSITGASPSMAARQSVTISRETAGRSSSASQPRPGPV